MASTTKHRIYGRDVSVKRNNTEFTAWVSVGVNLEGKAYQARAASSKVAQQDIFFDKATGEVRGLVTQGESLADLPKPGDIIEIAVGTVTEGADLLPTLNDVGDFVVLNTNYNQTEEAGEWSFTFESTGFEHNATPSPSQSS